MNRRFAFGLLLIAAGALALRLPQLTRRPMHTDESVHALKFKGLWENGRYRYDPNEYHGPTLYYATLPAVWFSSAGNFAQINEATLRIVPVLFGVGLILLLGLVRDGLGNTATLGAGALTALSPAMVFYSRYYIHELLLVFFTFLLMAAAWRYSRTGRMVWALLAGASLGLMHATKETFVIALGAMVLAVGLSLAWHRWIDRTSGIRPALGADRIVRAPIGWGYAAPRYYHGGGAVLVTALVSVLLFSAFFTNLSGPLDSIRTYFPWLNRAAGNSAHLHPGHYYLELLAFSHPARGPVWSEGLILILALVGLIAAFSRRGLGDADAAWVRFIAFYTVVMTAAYSLIPYKTPWCLLGFLHGMILLAGVGAAVWMRLWKGRGPQAIAALALVTAAGQLTAQACRANFTYCDDQRNPYVYAHTTPDLLRLVQTVERLAQVSPQHDQMLIKVMANNGDYWPLPWYLRSFNQVGWWDRVPLAPGAPVLIASPAFEAALEKELGNSHIMIGFFGLRPAVFLEVFVQSDLWQAYLESGLAAEE